MNRFKIILAAVTLSLFGSASAFAAELYVSEKTGANKNEGTKEAPLKNIWKALEKAAAGDTIHVAEGKYYGQTKRGWIKIDKALSLIGGYSSDFSQRAPTQYKTMMQPTNEMNNTKGQGIIEIEFKGKNVNYLIDGFVFDDGQASSFHPVKGKPEGVETGMYLIPPAKGNTQFPSREKYIIYGKGLSGTSGNMTIQNCVFANGSNYGIMYGHYDGNVRILNNVFINNRMAAADVTSTHAKPGTVNYEFAYNTVLFNWSRTNDFGDMGYGTRGQDKMNANIHHNILGLSINVGFDMTKGNDKTKHVKLDNNIFFLNKKGDLAITVSPSIQNIRVEAFEDLDGATGFDSIDGNVSLTDPSIFKGILNKAYLDGFLSASYSEKTDYDPNSPANTFRAAMGMNQRGTIQTQVTMFANRYPLDEVFKLFGANKTHGAQAIK